MMAQLESTFRFKCEVNNTNLHIERESDITSDDYDKNYENNESELQPKQEVEDKMEYTFVNICDKKFTIKKELLDVTEQQQETEKAQHQLESTLGFKQYKVNTTDLHIQRELLIHKYEDNELKDIENITIKSEILDIIEQPDEADLQIPRPMIIIKKNETDEDENISCVGNASESSENGDPAVRKDRKVCEAIKLERKDLSVTPLSYWSNGLPFTKELRVVLEDVMLTLGKQNMHNSSREATKNDKYYIKAQSVKNKVTGTHLIIHKGKLSNSNNMYIDSANTTEAAKIIYPGVENLHDFPKNISKKVCARTSTVNSNIDITHYDADSSKSVFICDICNKSYQKRISLYQHIQGHFNLFNCTYCKYSGQTNSNLKRHINTKHTKVAVYSCSYCSYRSFNRSTLTSHVNSKHTMNTVYNCPYCSYSTYVGSSLSRHVNSEHTKNNVYNCSYCSFSTYVRSTLTCHVNSKHTKNTVYYCSYCDHKTCYKSGLKRHINVIHTKINAFYCSYCNYKTYGKNTLAKHINSKHTKNIILKCGHCSYETYNKNNLRKHIKAKHNN